MRDFLKSAGRWLRTGWIMPLALLTLPMCGLHAPGCDNIEVLCDDSGDDTPDDHFEPGTTPTSAIMCDIPKFNGSGCEQDLNSTAFPSMAGAAVALNLGEEIGSIVLDHSPTGTSGCFGRPLRVEFLSPFPDGLPVCLNCGQLGSGNGAVYGDANKACIAKCKDMNGSGGEFLASEVDPFCAANAHVSTNFGKDDCYEGFCTMGGNPGSNYDQPRRHPEDLLWMDRVGTTLAGKVLSFLGPDPMTGLFSAGAASVQLITKGDAWVEFEAGEPGVSHVVGVRHSCTDIVNTCPDEDGTLADLPLVLSLNVNGDVNVVENGTTVLFGPLPTPFAAGERFRIYVTDHLGDGTADISFSRLDGQCVPNMACDEDVFYTYTGSARPSYPLRVDVSFREPNASLNNVTIMRIIE